MKFPDTTAMLASNITLECFALGKYVYICVFSEGVPMRYISHMLSKKHSFSILVCLFSPIPDIVWRKVDATDLPPNHEISESGAVLHLYNVQYEDVGGYECEAINTKGKDWHKAWLYVECK